MTRGRKWMLVGLLAITAAGRLGVATADPTSLIANEIYKDDAFYYFEIARNVAADRGFTVDGVAPTNGFQPLFLLALVPFFDASGGDRILPLHLAGFLAAALSVGTGCFLFFLMRKLAGSASGFLMLGLWAIGPYFIAHDVNGQETAMALFFSALLAWFYVTRLRESGSPSWRSAIVFGLAAGLAILARLDTVILLFALGLDWTWSRVRAGNLRRAIGPAALAAVAAFLVWLPWGLFIQARTGDALPLSGRASRLIALNMGWSNLRRIWSPVEDTAEERQNPDNFFFDADRPPALYFADVGTKLIFVSALELPPLALLRLNSVYEPHPRLRRYVPYALFIRAPIPISLAAITLIAGLGWWIRKRLPLSRGAPSGIGPLVVGYCLLMGLVYTIHCPAHWNFNRYMIVPILLATAQTIAWGRTLIERLPSSDWKRGIAWGCAVTLLACQAHQLRFFGKLSWREVEPAGFLKSAEAIAPYVEGSRAVGAFQSGVIGYFSNRDIVNLDGKVNRDALRALEARKIDEYVRERKLEYVMDWDRILYALYFRHEPDAARRLLRVPVRTPTAGVRLYRVPEDTLSH